MKLKTELTITFSIILLLFSSIFIYAIYFTESDSNIPMNISNTFTGNKLPFENIDVTFESLYGTIKITDKSGIRELQINNGVMGAMNINNKFEPIKWWEYLDFMTDITKQSNPKDVLILGVGAGIIPTRLNKQYNINVDAVDINKVVLKSAIKYFGMNPSNTLKLYEKDARMFLKDSNKKYDVIAMDIFKFTNGEYIIPQHLTTLEYFQLVKNNLKKNGYFVVMLIDNENSFLASQYKTINSIFNNVYLFNLNPIVLIASNNDMQFNQKQYKKEITGGIIYTDNFVPLI